MGVPAAAPSPIPTPMPTRATTPSKPASSVSPSTPIGRCDTKPLPTSTSPATFSPSAVFASSNFRQQLPQPPTTPKSKARFCLYNDLFVAIPGQTLS